jgi:hypothetical protein
LGGNNTGINTTFGGGLNYNNIIGNKTDFRSNYFYSRYNPNRQSAIQRQYFSPANLYQQNSYTDNLNNTHRLNFSVDYQIDSFHSIKISPSLSYQKTKNKGLSNYITYSEQGTKINEGISDNFLNNEGYNLNTNILFRKRFHKKGRTFSLNLLTNLNGSDGTGLIQSITHFYDQAGSSLGKDSINQKNDNEGDLKGYNARAVYTEPLFKKSLIEFSLGNSSSISTSSKTTYDYNANNGKFDLINDLLTNDYENHYGYTNAGLRIRKQTKKYNYAIGVSWQRSELKGTNESKSKDFVVSKIFRNFLPNARFQYYFSRFKNFLINYSTTTNQPSVAQLQPVPDNSNPLYVKLGNPNLKQEFIQNVRLNASLVNPYKNRNFFVYFTLQETQNKIVNYDRINSVGVDSVMPVNVNGVYNANGSVSWGFPVRFLKGSLELSSTLMYYKGKQPMSDATNKIEMNKINTLTLGPHVRLNMSPTEKLDLSISAGVNHSKSTYSVESARNSKYFNQEYSAAMDWELPKRFFFATDFEYTITNQYSAGFNAKIPLWNASISKQMLHFNRGELKFSVHDLLNKNVGINRSTNQNYIEESRIRGLRRFFLLSFTYSLTKTGLSNTGNGGGMKTMAH